jgi:hypothetical protein
MKDRKFTYRKYNLTSYKYSIFLPVPGDTVKYLVRNLSSDFCMYTTGFYDDKPIVFSKSKNGYVKITDYRDYYLDYQWSPICQKKLLLTEKKMPFITRHYVRWIKSTIEF